MPEAVGMAIKEFETGWSCWEPTLSPDFQWRHDALRRLGYHSLAPHGMCRLGDEPPSEGEEHWRRTLR